MAKDIHNDLCRLTITGGIAGNGQGFVDRRGSLYPLGVLVVELLVLGSFRKTDLDLVRELG